MFTVWGRTAQHSRSRVVPRIGAGTGEYLGYWKKNERWELQA